MLSSQAIVVAAVMIGIIIYINIYATSKEIGVMKAVGYQNRDVKEFLLRGYLDCRRCLIAGIFGCTRGGKFGECGCKSLLSIPSRRFLN